MRLCRWWRKLLLRSGPCRLLLALCLCVLLWMRLCLCGVL